jgi:hypothetical protein
MYAFDAAVNDARVVRVPRLDGFHIDVEGQLAFFASAACRLHFSWHAPGNGPLAIARPQTWRALAPTGMPGPLHLAWINDSSSQHSGCPTGIKKAVDEHRPKVVFLTSPNNPDGSMISEDELQVRHTADAAHCACSRAPVPSRSRRGVNMDRMAVPA